jgi:glycosyltransferase involved in cell wall biosynthesis
MTGTRRLCVIAHARFPIGEPRVERAVRAAAEDGYRVDVIALRGAGERFCERLGRITVWRMPVRHRRGAPLAVMALEYASFTLLASLWALALRSWGGTATVEVHSPPEFLVLTGLVPRAMGARLVLDVRDLSSHLWEARFGRSRGGDVAMRLLRWLERTACSKADAVITVHEPYRAQIAARCPSEQTVAVVMNAPRESLIGAVRRSVTPTRDGAFTVAYHGTITTWYGVDVLVRAIGLLHAQGRRIRARILGEGDQLEAVRRLAQEVGVSDAVYFSNAYVPIEDALKAVANADCGVIPNRPCEINRFILPNKLLEYVSLEIPVVSARLETVAAHFDDGEITLCDPGDAAALAGGIAWVMDEPSAARKKTLQAQARMRGYSWEASRKRYLELLAAPQSAPAGGHS